MGGKEMNDELAHELQYDTVYLMDRVREFINHSKLDYYGMVTMKEMLEHLGELHSKITCSCEHNKTDKFIEGIRQ